MRRDENEAATSRMAGGEELPLGRRAANLGRVLCLVGAALGGMGLLGWVAGLSILTIVVPGEPQMKANAAVSLLLLGIAGALRRHERTTRLVRAATSAAGAVVLAIGGLTLLEYAAGIDVGIDQLLFQATDEPHPGRPSPPTALALTALATALLSFDARLQARARPSEWMILIAALLGFVAIVGAALGAGPLYRMRSAPITGVAVPTALGLLLISAGMILERPSAGIARLATAPGPGGALLRRLALPGIVLPVLLAFGLSRLFALLGIRDVSLLFAALVALLTVVGLALLVSSARPLDRAHETLAASRAETRQLVQQAPDGIFVADLDGRYTDVNRAGCEMLGFSREEILGKPIVDLIPPGEVDRLVASKRYLLEKGAEVSEWRLRRKDGTYVPVEINAKILPDGRWQAFVRDITERKRAEEASRASEARYAGLISLAVDAIISIDDSQRIVIFNQGAEQIFGWKADEVLGQPLDILIPERLRKRHRQHICDFASQSDKSRKMGTRSAIFGLRKGGEEFPAEAAISKLAVAGGLVFTVVLRDVTEQLRMANEQRLFAEVGSVLAKTLDYEETLANIARLCVGAVADACVVETVEDGGGLRRLAISRADIARGPALEEQPRASGLVPHPLIGGPALEALEPLLVREVTPELLESLAEDDANCRTLRALAPTSLIALPLVVRGHGTGSLVLARTAESREFTPADLSRAQEMARRAALAIEHARLYQLSRDAVRARDDLLGIVAHDLRNPLGAITMQAEALLRKTPEGEGKARNSIEGIRRSASRMNRLIQDLLDVTRIEAGHLSIEPRQQPMNQIMADVIEMQKAIASAAGCEVRLDLPLGLPDVIADRDRLMQVFENLIGNAVKFAPLGGVITIGANARGPEIVFWVADSGPGIPADAQLHLFDRFWQAQRGDRRGAGLGLPIVKGIVEAHGGRIWVDSALGRGSTFFFALPAAPDDKDRHTAAISHGP